MGATPTAGLFLLAIALVGCGHTRLDAPVRSAPPPRAAASTPAPAGDASPAGLDLVAAVVDARARVQAIDDATTCDFHTPSAVLKRRRDEQKQRAAQHELDED